MRVFVTGASGWIGSASVEELLGAGHEVVGLARSDDSAAALAARGVEVLRGELDDLDSLRAGAEQADAVVHLANKHDFADQAVSNLAERNAVETLTTVLAGSDRPFVLASGVAGFAFGRPVTEEDASPFSGLDSPRGGAENLALERVGAGVRSVAVRFAPTVHGSGDHGFIAVLVAAARERGAVGYVGDGSNRWSAVHRSDAARLVRFAVEHAPAGSRLHAVAEEGITTREIAEAIGRGLGLSTVSVAPGDATEHLGWIGAFFAMDFSAASAATRRLAGWEPTGPTLAEDLASGAYFTG
ncbi:SDR family oxidoreductase [uncultured Friedmanniella sp.]|uniref:SDR family oxidoreductase n=1 Tax=uncultured Friedmanniella sp. TaxID=335381 RepID=UPI0035C9A7E3